MLRRSLSLALTLAPLVACSSSGGGATSTGGGSGGVTTSTIGTSSSSSSSGTTGGGGITLTVTSPTPGATVPLGTASDPLAILVSYQVTGFTLSTPGTCGVNMTTCGHVHIEIDGSACDAPGKPYNNSDASGNGSAFFEYCLVNTGSHTLHLDLHDDQHALIPGTPSADVQVTTTAPTSNPAIQIVDPQQGGVVALGFPDSGSPVPVSATVSNFDLEAPGTCAGAANCGQVRFFVDGTACNTSAGYNAIDPTAAGPANPALLLFAACATTDGGYSITAALYSDDGTAVMGAESGAVFVTGLPP